MHGLNAAPTSVADESGAPRFGTYAGALPAVDLSRLKGEHQLGTFGRLARHKRWLYTFAATHEVIALCAVVDVGYSSNSFTLVCDLKDGKVLCDQSVLGLPGPMVEVSDAPGEGLYARFLSPLLRTKVEWLPGSPRISLASRAGLTRSTVWDMELLAANAPSPLTVVAPVDGNGVNVTQKWAGLLTFGKLKAKGRTYNLDGGVGGMDYTHGYLARHTAWRWAFACGRLEDGTPVGMNLVEGFNEGRADVNENALWVGGRLIPLSRARFTWNKHDPLDAWDVETDDGIVQLKFRPIAAHKEHRDLKLVKSWFVQPVGLFEGILTVDGKSMPVKALPGVTEDQDILW